LYVTGTAAGRPDSRRTIFADGSADASFRDGVDLELSHWVPNRTPARFKADTSTEICMSFAASGAADYDLVVNNHADVDGVLSVFTLLHPGPALDRRAIVVAAAGMGDFAWWADAPAQVLFQSLTNQIDALTAQGTDPQVVYERALDHVSGLLERGCTDPGVEESLAPLRRSMEWLTQGRIRRRVHHDRFVHYAVPAAVAGDDLAPALRVPAFNAAISSDVLFWPQARARWDRDKVQLVSLESPEGWYYDLWYPSYVWADTPDSWRPPGLTFAGHLNGFALSWPPLAAAVSELQARESNGATWNLETDLSFSSSPARGYPVVLSALQDGRPAPSSLEPEWVARRLAAVWQG
jgi:hypothetical protein